MKKFIKTIVSLTAASAMLLSTTAFAATTKTVTKYSTTTGTTVTSTVSGLTEGSMVTYLAVKGKDQPVSEDGDNIVYIGQKTVDNTNTATFSYTLSGQPTVGTTYATVKYGSSVDSITDTNTIEVGSVKITGDHYKIVSGDKNVGLGDTSDLKFEAEAGYEIVDLRVAGGAPVDPEAAMVTVKAGDEVVIVTAATNTAAVYQLSGAVLEPQTGYKYETKDGKKIYTNAGIVRVIGKVKSVKFVFEDANGEKYEMNKGTADAKSEFEVTGLSENGGYYGVEIEDTTNISNLSVTATAVGDTDEVGVHKIFE